MVLLRFHRARRQTPPQSTTLHIYCYQPFTDLPTFYKPTDKRPCNVVWFLARPPRSLLNATSARTPSTPDMPVTCREVLLVDIGALVGNWAARPDLFKLDRLNQYCATFVYVRLVSCTNTSLSYWKKSRNLSPKHFSNLTETYGEAALSTNTVRQRFFWMQ